jgi:hypothetical protein
MSESFQVFEVVGMLEVSDVDMLGKALVFEVIPVMDVFKMFAVYEVFKGYPRGSRRGYARRLASCLHVLLRESESSTRVGGVVGDQPRGREAG